VRTWVAGCAVWLVIGTIVAFIGERRLGPAASIGIAALFIGLIVAATFAFNRGRAFALNRGRAFALNPTRDEVIRALAERGQLETRACRARRAFEVKESGDEGLHYFIELEDGSVLYLTGQYLYDYAPLDADDDEPATPRRFPCTSFELFRNRRDQYTFDIACAGEVLEPEAVTPPFSRRDHRERRVPKDAEVIAGKTYDELKAERLAGVAG